LKKEKIKLFGRDLFITERLAIDVYEFEFFSKGQSERTNFNLIYLDALFVHQGLKYNYDRLCFKISFPDKIIKIPFRPLRYLILKKILSPANLMKQLSISQLHSYINRIWFLETGEVFSEDSKKKVNLKVENVSAEKQPTILSQAVSV
jgi:hypothetical protein